MMTIIEKLLSLEQEATAFGFNWENENQIMQQILSECEEIQVHLKDQNKIKLQEEIGDLMHAVFSLCIFCQLDPAQTLTNSANKFEDRFNKVKQITNAKGLSSLRGLPFSELMEIWDLAKLIS